MHICIVGGIFDKPAEYRERHSISPETVLADGLRRRGCRVTPCGHATPIPDERFDLVHVHHFGRGALRLAISFRHCPFVFTTHDPFAMNGLPIGWRRRVTDGLVLHRADAVVALSRAERAFLMRCGLPPWKISIIPERHRGGFVRSDGRSGNRQRGPAVRRTAPGIQGSGRICSKDSAGCMRRILAPGCESFTRPVRY